MQIKTFKKALPYLIEAKITPMLVAPHGVGKSQSVRQFTEEMSIKDKTPWGFVDIRLGSMETGDLLGLPDFAKDKDGNNVATKFMKPDWLPTDPNSKGIIFLDEINRSKRDTLQAIFQLVLDRKIHDYELPKNWHVVAAMNPNTENYIVTDINDSAFLDRFCHIKLEPSKSEFFDYAENEGFDKDVVNFLKTQSDLLQENLETFSFDAVKPSRRSWEAVSRLRQAETPKNVFQELCFGLVGTVATMAFMESLNNSEKPLMAEDILKNYPEHQERIKGWHNKETGGRSDLIAATCDDLLKHCKKLEKKLSKVQEENLLKFLKAIPAEAAFSTCRELYYIVPLQAALNDDKELLKLIKDNKPKAEEIK